MKDLFNEKLTKKTKKLIKRINKMDPRIKYAFDHLEEKQEIKDCIDQCEENGQVAIVYGYMDCDCARVSDLVHTIPASVLVFQRWLRFFRMDAEGPQWSHIEKPSIARKLKSSERDLALEAFEDGHPHRISY